MGPSFSLVWATRHAVAVPEQQATHMCTPIRVPQYPSHLTRRVRCDRPHTSAGKVREAAPTPPLVAHFLSSFFFSCLQFCRSEVPLLSLEPATALQHRSKKAVSGCAMYPYLSYYRRSIVSQYLQCLIKLPSDHHPSSLSGASHWLEKARAVAASWPLFLGLPRGSLVPFGSCNTRYLVSFLGLDKVSTRKGTLTRQGGPYSTSMPVGKYIASSSFSWALPCTAHVEIGTNLSDVLFS